MKSLTAVLTFALVASVACLSVMAKSANNNALFEEIDKISKALSAEPPTEIENLPKIESC